MSSVVHPIHAASYVPSRQPVPPSASAGLSIPPAGTFVPGTKVQVGGHRVIIERYLSEGGFAHVYLVRLPKAVDGDDGAVLKRVAVPDKEALASMRTEVETMKKLKGHRHIVTYIDSHASQLKGGGYEVFLLMEYCAGGGLIDFMNTRLQNRLTEPEILKIFSDVAQGVACMHYLKPPLLHRDLKVENILISSSSSSRRYKLCDFGSTASPRPAATTVAEGRLIEDDVQKHTTLQYRSPEMIDVYRKQAIDEKSDIWALGVLLYKLCYYTTPFEEQGQMAILNASFKFPGYPSFTDKTKKLIASMLKENPQSRPNIYQVVREVCLMRGTDIPIKDIYSGRSVSEARRNQHLPSPVPDVASPPMVGAYKAPPIEEFLSIPDITPMRRGRPTKPSTEHGSSRPSPSPIRNVSSDPFAALDSAPASVPSSIATDEISTRFPPLDQFSILHDTGDTFAFHQITSSSSKPPRDISQRVTEALADEAFAQPASSKKEPPSYSKSIPSITSPASNLQSGLGRTPSINKSRPSRINEPPPQRVTMVSTGTMTSPSPPPPESKPTPHASRPIHRFPPSIDQRSSSQPRASASSKLVTPSQRTDSLPTQRSVLSGRHSNSPIANLSVPKSPSSSRPSLEGQRPSMSDLDNSMSRSKSVATRVRPSSAYLESTSRYSQSSVTSREKSGLDSQYSTSFDPDHLTSALTGVSKDGVEPTKISSNVDFLRAMEEEEPTKRKEKRSSSGSKHSKRASMPSISLSGTKSLLSGRFGEAFRRFETNTSTSNEQAPRSLPDRRDGELTPIAGSEATDGMSDDGRVVEETEETPPEVRRELERRRLSIEERRVAEGAAAYKQSLSQRDNGGQDRGRFRGDTNRAASIQNKVQALLDENGKSSPTKTAEGYGRFTDVPPSRRPQDTNIPRHYESQEPGKKPLGSSMPVDRIQRSSIVPSDVSVERPHQQRPIPTVSSAPPASEKPFPRPSAPPKPQALRTGGRGEPVGTTELQQGRDRKGDHEDWETNFSKKYPSLAGLEMVETDIEPAHEEGLGGITVRDV